MSNRRFAVAIHVLVMLSALKNRGIEPVSSRWIAKSVNTHSVVIRALLKDLIAAGLVKSKEGKGGGVFLARSPKSIRLDEVLKALGESRFLELGERKVYRSCPVSCSMSAQLPELFHEVDAAVIKLLKEKTLQSLVEKV